MSNVYTPEQELSYVYNKQKKTLCIKVKVTVPVNSNETLLAKKVPKISKKVTIEFNASSIDKPTPAYCKQYVLIPLLENLDSIEDIDQLREKIRVDLKAKNIDKYLVKCIIHKTETAVGGQKTASISGNAIIKIE